MWSRGYHVGIQYVLTYLFYSSLCVSFFSGVLPAAAQAYSGYVDDSITALNKMAANNKLQQAAIAAQSVTENSSYNAYLSKLARLQVSG